MGVNRFFYKKKSDYFDYEFYFWLPNYYKMILNNILPKILTSN